MHQEEALIGRLVEAELLFQAFDEFGIEALRAAIFGIDVDLRSRRRSPCGAEIAAEEPEMRDVAPVSRPESCAMTRSTGPPGANWMTVNETSMIPKIVGIMNSMRRRM